MDLFKGHSEAGAAAKLTPGTNRRTFMRGVAATLGIAVPAFKVLASPSAASAKVIPNVAACSKVYLTLIETSCGGQDGCPSGMAYACNELWERRSAINGQSCGTYTESTQRCGSNSCNATPATSAQATC